MASYTVSELVTTTYQVDSRPIIRSPDDVQHHLADMASLRQEQLRVMSLTAKNRLMHVDTIYQGTLTQASVRIAELFRWSVANNANAILIAHNHPSGDPVPSAADIQMTQNAIDAGRILEIPVLDSIIICEFGIASLRRLNLCQGWLS